MKGFATVVQRWLLVSLVLSAFTLQVRAASDLPGSSDLPGIARYPLSYIVFYEQRPVPQYRLALGSMRKVNGVVFPERERYVEGLLTRITYRIPEGRSSEEAFEFLLRALDLGSDQVLFQCRGRDCGSSNEWANAQFDLANLYGLDRNQFYLAARLKGASPGYLAAYAIRRGNGRVYLHLDHIQPPQPAIDGSAVSVVLKLSQGERVYLEPDDSDRRLSVLVEALAKMFEEDSRRRALLVGHAAPAAAVAEAQQRSLAAAEALKTYLVGQGMPASRLEAFGVGGLAPAYDHDVPEHRIEVLVR